MMKVGLTGGMGSGKTTVAKIFEAFRIPVFYADEESKKILASNPNVKAKLVEKFGEKLFANGRLNRSYLANEIFKNKEALAFVNSVLHPAVAEAFLAWSKKQTAPYVLEEAAILFETGGYKKFDSTILVVAEKELRVKRVKARGGLKETEVLARMENQWSDEKKLPLADFVIYNDEKEMLTRQVLEIHENLISRADTKN